jgi:hypothetical protein
MSEAHLIPPQDPDRFKVFESTWTIIRHSTNQVEWTGKGSGLGLMVENDSFLAAFEGMFPRMVVRWGAGPYRLTAVVLGVPTGRLGNMAAFWEAPDVLTANAAKKEIMAGLAEPSFITRTTRKTGDKLPLRTHAGTLDGNSGTVTPVGAVEAPFDTAQKAMPGLLGYGNVIDEKPPVILSAPVATPEDNPNFDVPPTAEPLGSTSPLALTPTRVAFLSGMTTLANVLRGTLVQRHLQWIARLQRTAAEFTAEGTKTVLTRLPLQARFHVGQQVITEEIDSKVLYQLAKGNAAHQAYLDWFAAYQEVEMHLFNSMERFGEDRGPEMCDVLKVAALMHEMVYDAETLYLVESGRFDGLKATPEVVKLRAEVIQGCCDFIAAKDADYGQAIRRHGAKGLVIRLYDKFSRYTILASRPDRAGKFESLEDTAKDLLCYSLMLYAYWCEYVEDEKPELGV